ncbi:MAG: hypothetical protein AAF092_00570 [Pseudomonadota bacterium]
MTEQAADLSQLADTGWLCVDDAELLPWVTYVAPHAAQIAADPDARKAWLRHGGTWFAGVNSLPNDVRGALPGGPQLRGRVVRIAGEVFGSTPTWDAGQLSIVYPGYPRQDPGESDAAHRFRRTRDAAHVDGLLPVGPARRRMMQEPHAFVLGIPLNACAAGASPMVVWEGSHEIMRAAFRDALAQTDIGAWAQTDLTEIYQSARKHCFETCTRRIVHAQPGQAYIIHRLTLHGVAPWESGAEAPEEGRMIAYFRPAFPRADWLTPP